MITLSKKLAETKTIRVITKVHTFTNELFQLANV